MVERLSANGMDASNFVYDTAHRLVELNQSYGSRVYSRDAESRVTSVTVEGAGVYTFSRDSLGRETNREILEADGGFSSVATTYDEKGNIISLVGDGVSEVYTYNSNGIRQSIVRTIPSEAFVHSTSREFPSPGVELNSDNFGFSATITRDLNQRVSSVDWKLPNQKELRLEYSRDDAGRITSTRATENEQLGIVSDLSYNLDGLLSSATYKNAHDAVFAQWSGSWDSARRLISEVTDSETTIYSYDLADQLVNETTHGNAESYPYDANGRRNGSAWITTSDGLIRSNGNETFEYDGAGRRTRMVDNGDGSSTLFEYNGMSQVTQVVRRSPLDEPEYVASFLYDHSGNRIRTTVDPDGNGPEAPSTHFHLYFGVRRYADLDSSGNLVRFYATGAYVDEVFATIEPTVGMQWLAHDHQYTPIAVLNESNDITHLAYSAFGAVQSLTLPTVIGFQGRPYDPATQTYDFRARWYDPSTGTFLTPDPLNLGAGDTNLHNFGFNSPTNHLDPSGNLALVEYAFELGCMTIPTAINAASLMNGVTNNGGVIKGFEALNDFLEERPIDALAVAAGVLTSVVNFVAEEFLGMTLVVASPERLDGWDYAIYAAEGFCFAKDGFSPKKKGSDPILFPNFDDGWSRRARDGGWGGGGYPFYFGP